MKMSILVMLFAFLLAGCGQKGPLYLPPADADPTSHAQARHE